MTRRELGVTVLLSFVCNLLEQKQCCTTEKVTYLQGRYHVHSRPRTLHSRQSWLWLHGNCLLWSLFLKIATNFDGPVTRNDLLAFHIIPRHGTLVTEKMKILNVKVKYTRMIKCFHSVIIQCDEWLFAPNKQNEINNSINLHAAYTH